MGEGVAADLGNEEKDEVEGNDNDEEDGDHGDEEGCRSANALNSNPRLLVPSSCFCARARHWLGNNFSWIGQGSGS